MSEEEKPPSPEELKAMMEKAAKAVEEKRAAREAQVGKLDLSDKEALEKHLAEKASKQG
ncbi:MAG: hypothetical protein ACXQS8_08165 [Candidatus Helarchaeales archaeon]